MNRSELTALLIRMGCPIDNANGLATQLDRRARQLAEQKGRTYEDALVHLLNLVKQGWAAKEKGL